MPCIRTESFEVFADYHQFYVQDGVVNPPAPEDWTDADVAHRAKAATNVVVVCPVRNMTVPVQVELHDVAPELQDKAADHLVECSLALPSGHLQVHECTGGAVLNWQLEPGQYEVAVLYSRLDSISADGRSGDDHYQVLLWPGAELVAAGVSVVYFQSSTSSRWFERLITSVHGASLAMLYFGALGIHSLGIADPKLGKAYWLSLLVPCGLALYAIARFSGNKKIHLLQLVNLLAAFWIWFVGTMAVTGNWL